MLGFGFEKGKLRPHNQPNKRYEGLEGYTYGGGAEPYPVGC
jgi:hypothetical protein